MYENYVKYRDAKGYKDADVTRATGIRSGTLSDWKHGRYQIKQDKLMLIADFLGITLDQLMYGEEDGYYLDKKTAALAQEIYERPDLHVLMDAAKDCSPDAIMALIPLIRRLKETNPNA